MQTNPLTSGHHDDSASTDVVDEITDCARVAEDAIRRLAHLTIGRSSMTPADLDTVLAHLAATIGAVPQVANQLGRILGRSGDTPLLAMDGMTATTDPDLAVDTARRHLDAVRHSTIATYRHVNSARIEVAHVSASTRANATDSWPIAEAMPAPDVAGSRRHEDREPPNLRDPIAWDRLGETPTRRPTAEKGEYVQPIHIPDEWHDDDLLTLEQFCELIHTAEGTVRDWRRRRPGPRWFRFEGCGRLYVTVGEARRFVNGALLREQAAERIGSQGRPL